MCEFFFFKKKLANKKIKTEREEKKTLRKKRMKIFFLRENEITKKIEIREKRGKNDALL